jgi:hypothetical protein
VSQSHSQTLNTPVTPLAYGVPYRIRNKVHANYVVDFAGSNLGTVQSGQAVTLSRYIGDTDQYWVFHEDGRVTSFYYGTCLDARINKKNPAQGVVVASNCLIADATQTWSLEWNGFVLSNQFSNLTLLARRSGRMSSLSLRAFNETRRTQQWFFEAIPTFALSTPSFNEPVAISHDFTSLVLSPITVETSEQSLRLWNYRSSDSSQLWLFRSDGTIINLDSLQCLTVANSTEGIGVASCASSNPDQQWLVTPEKFIQNRNGKFLGFTTTPIKGKSLTLTPGWIGKDPRLSQFLKWNFLTVQK